MSFFDKAKELGNAAINKGKDLAEITRLNIDIASIENKITDCEKRIGEIVVTEKISIDNEEIIKSLEKISHFFEEINNKKNEIIKMENKE